MNRTSALQHQGWSIRRWGRNGGHGWPTHQGEIEADQKPKLWLGHRRGLYARWSLPGVPQGPDGLPQSLWLFLRPAQECYSPEPQHTLPPLPLRDVSVLLYKISVRILCLYSDSA